MRIRQELNYFWTTFIIPAEVSNENTTNSHTAAAVVVIP
jgi:hypothetical protein